MPQRRLLSFLNYGKHPHAPAAIFAKAALPQSTTPVTRNHLKKLRDAQESAQRAVDVARQRMKERFDACRQDFASIASIESWSPVLMKKIIWIRKNVVALM